MHSCSVRLLELQSLGRERCKESHSCDLFLLKEEMLKVLRFPHTLLMNNKLSCVKAGKKGLDPWQKISRRAAFHLHGHRKLQISLSRPSRREQRRGKGSNNEAAQKYRGRQQRCPNG
jgi:hypothetical protein